MPSGAAGAVPILALTRRGDLKRKLAAFDQGVDDVLTVPFSPEELLARVVVITRRTYGTGSGLLSALRLGEIEIDIVNRQVIAGWSTLHLTALDMSLLYLLAANAGRVVSRDEILDAVWGPDFIAESNIVDRHIRSLRAKLQNDFRKSAIHRDRPRTRLPLHRDCSGRRRASARLAERAEEMPDQAVAGCPAEILVATNVPMAPARATPGRDERRPTPRPPPRIPRGTARRRSRGR